MVCQGDEEGVYWNQLLQRGSLNFYKREPGQGTKTNLKLTTFKKGAYRNHSKTKRLKRGVPKQTFTKQKPKSVKMSRKQPFTTSPLLRPGPTAAEKSGLAG